MVPVWGSCSAFSPSARLLITPSCLACELGERQELVLERRRSCICPSRRYAQLVRSCYDGMSLPHSPSCVPTGVRGRHTHLWTAVASRCVVAGATHCLRGCDPVPRLDDPLLCMVRARIRVLPVILRLGPGSVRCPAFLTLPCLARAAAALLQRRGLRRRQ
jgi:hypothetical protein